MDDACFDELPLGRIFGVLTKKYIGLLVNQMESTPVDRYFYPLLLIGKNSGKICQQELADRLLSDKVSVVRMIDTLEKQGLIERKINPEDRRKHLLFATEKAKPWIGEIENAINKANELFLSFLQKENQGCFKGELLSIVKSVMDMPVQEIEIFYDRIKKKKNDKTN